MLICTHTYIEKEQANKQTNNQIQKRIQTKDTNKDFLFISDS